MTTGRWSERASALIPMEDNDAAAADRDGLADRYDAIVLGTGLVESIVACALARGGRKVLHLDSGDRYGSCCAAIGFDAFVSGEIGGIADSAFSESDRSLILMQQGVTNFDAPEGLFRRNALLMRVVDRGDSMQASQRVSSKAVLVPRYKQRNPALYHPACIGYCMEKEGAAAADDDTTSPVFSGYLMHKELTAHRASAMSNDFNIDLTSLLLLAGGSSIDHLVNSGVSAYLEFKAVDSLHFCMAGGAPAPVPCSKSDVFNTKSLSGPEKRALMKFLQFAIDWGREAEGADPQRLNESELAQGRSLHRPQNKIHSALAYDVRSFAGKSFPAFLRHCGISARMQQMICYALCLCTEPRSAPEEGSERGFIAAEEGLRRLCTHLNSLGRFGPTAFLSPVYGCSELPQAFCRMCAVWGGVYVLRNGVSRLLLGAGGTAVEGVEDEAGRSIGCDIFVCASTHLNLSGSRTAAAAVCRTCVFSAAVLPDSLAVAVIPPCTEGVGNAEAIVAVQADSSTSVAPTGAVVLHLTMHVTVPATLSDSGEWDEYSKSGEMALHSGALGRALDLLLGTDKNKRVSVHVHPREIAHLTTVRPIEARRQDSHCPSLGAAALPRGVAVCGDTSCAMDLDAAFAQAQEIVRALAPDLAFFPKNELAGEQDGEEADDVGAEELQRALRQFGGGSSEQQQENIINTM